jgi:hypothetical protein
MSKKSRSHLGRSAKLIKATVRIIHLRSVLDGFVGYGNVEGADEVDLGPMRILQGIDKELRGSLVLLLQTAIFKLSRDHSVRIRRAIRVFGVPSFE